MSTTVGSVPQGPVVQLGIPDSVDIPRLVYCAPYFQQVPLAELIEPSVQEAVEALLPSLVPPYVSNAAEAAVQQLAVLKTGSTMSGPLMLAPLMPTADSMAATKAYVDALVATAGVPEVPVVPVGQTWARQVGQWVPLDPSGGNFLPISGGVMQGNINMSGYAINNLAALPNMPNGAAPANWVLQQIASVSLYQGTWNMDTYVPDLTNPNTHVNGYTWIAITTSTSGVVISPPIPGLQGQTVFNGDTIIWSNIQGQFNRIHSGGLSLAEAQALFLPFTGGTMTGPLLAFENPTAPMEVATMGWVESLIPTGGIIPEAPTDGQLYGRNGLTHVWQPVLPLAGGVMTGPILLSGNATNGLNPVPLSQMQSTLSATYLALAGGTMTGPIVLSGNASANLNPVPLQQLTAMLGGYVPTSSNSNITASLGVGLPPPAAATVPNLFANNVVIPLTNSTLRFNQYAASLTQANYLATGYAGSVYLDATGNLGLAVYPSGTAGNAVGATVASIWLDATNTLHCNNVAVNTIQGNSASFSGSCNAGGSTIGGVVLSNNNITMGSGGITGTSANLTGACNATAGGTIGGVSLSSNNVAALNVYSGWGQPSQINMGATYGGGYPNVNNNVNWGIPTAAWFQVASYNFPNPSDPRNKRDMVPSPTGALAKIEAIPVYNFVYASDETGKLVTGFDATEVRQHHEHAVMVGSDEAQTLAINLPDMIALLWQAVQELSGQVKGLRPA